jgi:pilus assembly protein CpaF
MTDPGLVDAVTRAVKEGLADARSARDRDHRQRMSDADERAFARQLVARELDRLAHHRLAAGVDPLDHDAEEAIAELVMASTLGLARLQPYLDDPNVQDIHVRGCESTWLKRRDGARLAAPPVVDTDEELVELIRLVAARMGRTERRFDAAAPELNFQLADGSRLFAVMDVSTRPSLVIRKHLFSLASIDELRERGMIDHGLLGFLAAGVRARRNLIVTGGTGTGKTTLLRALLNEVPVLERIITIEDAYELGLDRFPELHPDHDALQARPANIEGHGAISMLDLARMALRMDPDRVVVGEVRGGEAFPMLMAMSQGNNGSMCTMHADSSKSVFPKLAAYVAMADTALPVDTVNLLIATALHFVVHIEMIDGVRRVASVREVVDADGARIVSNEVYAPALDGRAVPAYPMRATTLELLEAHGFDPGLLDKPDGWWDQ